MTHLPDDRLQALADGGAADAHLDACETCRREVAAYRRLAARLSHLDLPEPPLGFAAAVMRRIGDGRAPFTVTLALLLAGCASLFGLIALSPGRPRFWPAMRALVLVTRVLRGVLLSDSGMPLLATALVVLLTAFSIRQLVKESQT